MPTIHNFAGLKLGGHDRPYGFKASFNRPSVSMTARPAGGYRSTNLESIRGLWH